MGPRSPGLPQPGLPPCWVGVWGWVGWYTDSTDPGNWTRSLASSENMAMVSSGLWSSRSVSHNSSHCFLSAITLVSSLCLSSLLNLILLFVPLLVSRVSLVDFFFLLSHSLSFFRTSWVKQAWRCFSPASREAAERLPSPFSSPALSSPPPRVFPSLSLSSTSG